MRTALSRRAFLGASAAALVPPAAAADPAADVAFFVVGDTHYLADKPHPDKLDATSAATNARLVDVLNKLPGTAIPAAAGGGTVAPPKGVIHAGDVIDSGDKAGGVFPQMQQAEWQGFAADYGLTGKDGRLKFPVYEIHGNHDAPHGEGVVLKKIAERNKTRPGVTARSANGLHYAWRWGPVHFVNLGIVVGSAKGVARKRRYAPLDSLDFLTAHLAGTVGPAPVVLTHHVDVLRYATDAANPPAAVEWDPADVRAYYDAIKGHNVVAIFYGHTHVRTVYRWDGTTYQAEVGIPTFNVDNSAHYGSKTQAAFYVHVTGDTLTVRELATDDRWESFEWTPEAWVRPVAKKG